MPEGQDQGSLDRRGDASWDQSLDPLDRTGRDAWTLTRISRRFAAKAPRVQSQVAWSQMSEHLAAKAPPIRSQISRYLVAKAPQIRIQISRHLAAKETQV